MATRVVGVLLVLMGVGSLVPRNVEAARRSGVGVRVSSISLSSLRRNRTPAHSCYPTEQHGVTIPCFSAVASSLSAGLQHSRRVARHNDPRYHSGHRRDIHALAKAGARW